MAATVAVQPATHPSPYHFGEQSVQNRIGTRSVSDRVGAFIRNYLTDQAREFFEDLPLLYISARSQDGSVWATTLCGQPGFIKAIDNRHFAVDLKQMYGDAVTLKEGDSIGSVGIMLHNRRRNRLNCIVESRQPDSMILRVTQSFGNCPKYIQVRNIVVDSRQLASLGTEERTVTRGDSVLGPDQRSLIARCDMLFLGTSFMGVSEGADGMNGCDCNDRGGPPGFVQVSGDGTLQWGDYIGNNMFMSLGNIVADPRCGIQFIDFATGDSLQLTGQARILWDERSLPGAQRTIEFTTVRWVHIRGGLPISTKGAVEMSPYLPLDNGMAASMMGLKVASVKQETPDVKTFGFTAPRRPEGSPPFCEAGQFASFDFPRPNGKTLNRTWTISSPPGEIAETGRFTISVKKAGLVSTFLHEEVGEMSELVFRGVDGEFTLDRAAKCIPPAGVLLVAGGIGVTPIRAMLSVCIQRGYPVTLIYSVRQAVDAAFLSEFKETAAAHDNMQLVLILTGQGEKAVDGVATFLGRLKAAVIEQVCPDVTEREVFQCGPDTMMNSVVAELKGLGVSSAHIHQESFNF